MVYLDYRSGGRGHHGGEDLAAGREGTVAGTGRQLITCTAQRKQRENSTLSVPSKPTPIDPFPPARCHLLKNLQFSHKCQGVTHMSTWGHSYTTHK